MEILDEPMKTPIALAICSSPAALAAGPFVIDKADPEAAVKRRAAAGCRGMGFEAIPEEVESASRAVISAG